MCLTVLNCLQSCSTHKWTANVKLQQYACGFPYKLSWHASILNK